MTVQAETAGELEVEARPVVREYPIDNLRERGHWVAAITGPDPQYVVARSFLNGATKGRERLYGPGVCGAPAWVLRGSVVWCSGVDAAGGAHCSGCVGKGKLVELIAAGELGWSVVGVGISSADLLKLWESGPPGEDPIAQVNAILNERGEVYGAGLEDPF